MPDNAYYPASAMPPQPHYYPEDNPVDPLFQGIHSSAFSPQKTPCDPAAYGADTGFHSVQPVTPVSNMDQEPFDPDDPSKVPDDQVIVGRQPRTLSSIEWLGEQIKNGFASFVRTFKMMGILFSIWWNDRSVDSIKNAAESAQGGILVKAIQFACSSPSIAKGLFGDDHEKFTKALSHVTTSNKPMTKAELVRCLDEAGIDYDPDELDNRKNLGTGSIGEVNEIILKGGGRLIVKTVSPASETRVYSDLRILRFMLGLISFFSPSTIDKGTKHAIFSFFDSVKEEVNLITEANRTRQQEYANKAVAKQHIFDIKQSELPECAFLLPSRPYDWAIRHPDTNRVLLRLPVTYKVPAVYGDSASPHALGMEKIDGVTLSENDQPNLREIAAKLFNIEPDKITDDHLVAFRFSLKKLAFDHWAYCYAQTGFFNADMHDGNVMVAVENGRLVIYFIDLGNAQKVSRNTVKATYTILGAMEKLREESDEEKRSQYADEVVKCLHKLGDYESDKAKWDELKQEVLQLMPYRVGGDIESKIIELFNRAYTCNVKIPKETAGLFRAKMLIDSQVDMTDEARKSLDKIVPSLIELLGSDDSSADSGSFMLNVADQNALLMLLQQDPRLRAELLGLLRTMPISEDQLRYAVSELTSKTHVTIQHPSYKSGIF